MKRFLLTSSVIFALIVSVGIYAPSTHAQSGVLANPAPVPNFGATPPPSPLAPTGPTVLDSIISAQTGQKAPADPPTPAGFSGLTEMLNGVMSWILSIFAWLLGIAMVTLDNTVYYTVVKMGAYVQQLSAIGITWSILRDIGNIALIFGFLAVGITTILDVDWYGGGTKFLPGLVIAAVFLNFSLFMTEAVIDTGNLFATQFYTQINGGVSAGTKVVGASVSLSGGVATQEAISSKIMNTLKLQTLYGAARTNNILLRGTNIVFISLMGIGLFLVASFVMFSLAFILIARFIALIFLIILAPVGFAGLAIPMLKNQAKKWWDMLFEQTITAPILLLLLYIALRVITDSQFLSFGGVTSDYVGFIPNADGSIDKLPNLASAILTFAVAMGLLFAVTLSAKKLSAFGSSWATSTAGKLTFGATGLALRSTVGAGLYGASRAARGRLGGGKFERMVAGGLDRGANARFDLRNIRTFGGLSAAGVDAGKGSEHGYKERRENAIKGHKEYAKSVNEAIDERSAGAVAAAALRTHEAQRVADEAKERKEAEIQPLQEQVKNIESELKRLEKERTENDDSRLDGAIAQARTNLKAAEDKVKNKQGEVTKFENAAKNAKIEEENLGTKISNEKKDAQLKYADSIKGSFAGWLMFGPGGTSAVHGIVKDALKKKDKMRQIEEIIKEGAEEKPEKGGKKETGSEPERKEEKSEEKK